MAEIRRKLVIVGDGACGKTCLLMYVLVAMPSQAPALSS
jgi:GTPase SAR1 family protein